MERRHCARDPLHYAPDFQIPGWFDSNLAGLIPEAGGAQSRNDRTNGKDDSDDGGNDRDMSHGY
jgi:hypothetical protein